MASNVVRQRAGSSAFSHPVLRTSNASGNLDSPNAIVAAVSAHFHVSPHALASRSRAKDLTYARHVAMYLLRENAHCSFTDIGRILGGRDHATALYAYTRITREIPIIPETARDISALRQQLSHAAPSSAA